MKAKHALDHRLWAALKSDQLLDVHFLLACSGGADSMAMLRAFAALRPVEKLSVCFVHHGAGENQKHRDEAEAFVAETARVHGIQFISKRHSGPSLRTEAQFRDARRALLEQALAECGGSLIVTAHHEQDLLETRLIRLLRGTGPDGLPAIRRRRDPWYRPWLEVPRQDLRDYLSLLKQDWLEDPTNSDPRFLRNWLRTVWLPQLETYRAGANHVLSRSLNDLAQKVAPQLPAGRRAEKSSILPRIEWETQSKPERLQRLAQCLRSNGVTDFTRGQLEEIHRRLDISRKEHSFKLGGCLWSVNAQQISVAPDRKA